VCVEEEKVCIVRARLLMISSR